MPEGSFPKSDGDIFFASEANRFARGGRYFFIGSLTQVGSQTAVNNMGSVVINTGSLSNPAHILITYHTSQGNTANVSDQRWTFSGNVNNTLNVGTSTALTNARGIVFAVLGSPGSGFIQSITDFTETFTDSTNLRSSRVTLDNFYTGSTFVIQVSGINASTNHITLSVQGFRGVE